MTFQDPSGLAQGVSAILNAPDAFKVTVEERSRGSRHVLINPRAVTVTEDVLPRLEARIEITGTGRFILRLDDVMTLEEIYDHDDAGVLEILSDFCALAENYLRGAGTVESRVTVWGNTHVSIALAAGENQYLLVGRLPRNHSGQPS